MGRRQWKRVSAGAVLLAGALAVAAHADLYTGGVLSVEWLVDSSDEIYWVRLERPSPEEPLTIRPQEALWGDLGLETLRALLATEPERLVSWGKDSDGTRRLRLHLMGGRMSNLPAREGDEWMLFVRKTEGEPFGVVRAIWLTRPLWSSGTAAVTAAGKPLADKAAVLRAVHERLKLNRRPPEGCNRELIDRWNDNQDGVVAFYWEATKRNTLLEKSDVAAMRGGFAISISCDYWDSPQPGGLDEDLLLTHAIVPADPEYASLFSEVKNSEPRVIHEVFALMNYPEQAKKLWAPDGQPRGKLAKHLFYRENSVSPLDKHLFGQWTLLGTHMHVRLDLRKDHSCSLVQVQHPGTTNEREGACKGYWAVQDGHFWLARTHVTRNGEWFAAYREYFPPKRIEKVTPEEIVLEGGPPMKRR